MKTAFFAIFLGALTVSSALACPLAASLIDYNCDQSQRIVFLGDSLVRGIKDEEERGGYVGRVRPNFPRARVISLGVPGTTTTELLRSLKSLLPKPKSSTRKKITGADTLILDVGRNDFWLHNNPNLTVRDIKRILGYLRDHYKSMNEVRPFLVVSTLAPTSRGFQRPFIEEVNRLLLLLKNRGLPVFIRYDMLDVSIISEDGIHPNAAGYSVIAETATSFLKGDAQDLEATQRKDRDHDGIYDFFEESKYLTNPSKLDTDNDLLNDGDEEFAYHTSPVLLDTDGDGTDDKTEIDTGRNPLDPLS